MKNIRYALIALLMTACALDGANLIGPAGGFVFFDKGSYSDGWRYLEAAPENAGVGTWDRANELCAEYSLGGYDNWYLPTTDELEELLNGGMFENGVFWSSTEESGSTAWGIQNGDKPEPNGNRKSSGKTAPAVYTKSYEYWAWPVRRF
jgi:hypothetical protein